MPQITLRFRGKKTLIGTFFERFSKSLLIRLIQHTSTGPGSRERDEDDGHRDVRYQLDTPKPPARRLSRSTMSLKISPEKSAKPPQFQFFPSTPKACLTVPMTPAADPSIPTGFSPQLYQAYTSNRATDFFFKQLDGKCTFM